VNGLLKYKLLRRFFIANSLDIVMGVVLPAFWVVMFFVRPSFIITISIIPVVVGFGVTFYCAVKNIKRLAVGPTGRIIEGSLELKAGVLAGEFGIEQPADGKYEVFLETSRNGLEGEVILRRITSSAIRETVERFRPGWRRFSRRPNFNPIEFELHGTAGERVCLDFDLRLANPALYRKRLDRAERILILVKGLGHTH